MTELGEFAMYLAVGFTSLGLLFGPIGTAVARRIGGHAGKPDRAELAEVEARLAALESGQHRLAELEERVDFAERLLAQGREPQRLEG